MTDTPERMVPVEEKVREEVVSGNASLYKTLPIEKIRLLLDYDPHTGVLTWKQRDKSLFSFGNSRANPCATWNTRYANRPAFTSRNAHGYFQGHLLGTVLKAHRVAWAIYYGHWPFGEIDHINGDTGDNRILNLREVSHLENGLNLARSIRNTSGFVGVTWNNKQQRWRAVINHNGRGYHLGSFILVSDAVAARKAAELAFGFHANHGREAVYRANGGRRALAEETAP
jgi:hypothetical protein